MNLNEKRKSTAKEGTGFDSPPPPSGTNCWICLDDDGQLLRNCACRGYSSGYAHVSCLAEHARTVSEKAFSGQDLDIVRDAWSICPNCKQEYNGHVAFEMAEAFAEYASRLPNDSFPDEIRFDAQMFLGAQHQQSGNLNESRTIYERLLDSLHGADTTEKKSREAFLAENLALNYAKEAEADISCFSEYLEKARASFEKAHRINVEVHGAESKSATRAQYMLAHWCGDAAARVKTARACYDLTVKTHGKESRDALVSAKKVAMALDADSKPQEATELLEETIVKARRILGPEHPDTRSMEELLEGFAASAAAKMPPVYAGVVATISGLTKRPDLDGEQVEVLRHAKDGKYVVRMKRRSNDNGEDGKLSMFKAKKTNLIFSSGTHVTMIDLVKAKHLNGETGRILSYQKDAKRYDVAVGEDFRGLIKPDNLELVLT